MKKLPHHKPDRLAIVIGAGATRACSFVDGGKFSCLPPLDADFFSQLQRVPDVKHRQTITEVMTDMVNLFGNNFNLTLETAFTTIEHTLRMLEATRASSALETKKNLREIRGRLMSAIAVALEAALTVRGENGHATHESRHCENHEKIVQNVLEAGDHVISFNYDCVIDYALKRHGHGKWDPRYGYGFKLGPRGVNLMGDQHWAPEARAEKGTTIHVHKLHGSMHFMFKEPTDRLQRSHPKVTLKLRPYTKQRGVPRFSIIPPESNKAYDKGLFAELWCNAAQSLSSVKHVVVIGYSFPVTDLHASSLFRTSIKSESLKSLVIVNPDKSARRRAREVLQRGLTQTTRVISFDSLSEFLATDKTVWRW